MLVFITYYCVLSINDKVIHSVRGKQKDLNILRGQSELDPPIYDNNFFQDFSDIHDDFQSF